MIRESTLLLYKLARGTHLAEDARRSAAEGVAHGLRRCGRGASCGRGDVRCFGRGWVAHLGGGEQRCADDARAAQLAHAEDEVHALGGVRLKRLGKGASHARAGQRRKARGVAHGPQLVDRQEGVARAVQEQLLL